LRAICEIPAVRRPRDRPETAIVPVRARAGNVTMLHGTIECRARSD